MQLGHYLEFVEASRGILSGAGPLETDTSGLERSGTMFRRTREGFGHSRQTLRQATLRQSRAANYKYKALLRQEAAAAGDGYNQHLSRAPFIDAADAGDLEELLKKGVPGTTAAFDGFPPMSESKDVPSGMADQTNAEIAAAMQEMAAKEEDISSTSEELTGWKKFANTILPHIGLVLLTCTYTLIGASVFYNIEHKFEKEYKQQSLQQIHAAKTDFLKNIYHKFKHDSNNFTEEEFLAFGESQLTNVTDLVADACAEVMLSAEEIRTNRTNEVWTFPTAIFFAVTVVTTIGYGTPVPLTFTGRLVCIFFALLGVPLTLLTIADVGKFFSEHLIWLYGCYLKLLLKIKRKIRRMKKLTKEEKVCDNCRQSNHHPHSTKDNRMPSSTSLGVSGPLSKERRGSSLHHDYLDPFDFHEETVPATLLLLILIGYTALGGLLLQNVEDWTFFESFYFSFITMTTIGFGDLVPTKDGHIFVILVYIILGLIITTMCIDLVGVHYVQKIHYFGRKIQDARSALAIVGGKVVYVSELYAHMLARRQALVRGELGLMMPNAYVIENLFLTKHLIPFIPRDIKLIRYIDEGTESITSGSSYDTYSCKYCHNRMCSRVSHGFANPGAMSNIQQHFL